MTPLAVPPVSAAYADPAPAGKRHVPRSGGYSRAMGPRERRLIVLAALVLLIVLVAANAARR